ncbi:MAG: hypothetical protein BWK80_09655 [Desulfobacteraceae bacterium IS3]|jgi:hypothetical protein|nr:MAG: hypothetical protein BWK80_09655 [Desulfobacteraceae bacterium IS3]HAO20863.1 hypothetical protein [Desulfobacteraceae bacterium]
MSVTEKRLQTLEREVMYLRLTLQKFMVLPYRLVSQPKKDRSKLTDLFGAWEGEIDTFLEDFYRQRERRGRIE